MSVELIKMKRRQNAMETELIKQGKLLEKTHMSAFDPETFLSGTTENAGDTHFTPIPEGEYQAIIADVHARAATGKDGREFVVLDTRFEVLDDEVRNDMGMERIFVQQSYFCDLNSDGLLEWGTNKNVKLGQLRNAVGQNVDGEPWSPSMLKGAGPLAIYVTINTGEDDITRNRVKSTAPITD